VCFKYYKNITKDNKRNFNNSLICCIADARYASDGGNFRTKDFPGVEEVIAWIRLFGPFLVLLVFIVFLL